jgi:hypothetical protein
LLLLVVAVVVQVYQLNIMVVAAVLAVCVAQ